LQSRWYSITHNGSLCIGAIDCVETTVCSWSSQCYRVGGEGGGVDGGGGGG